MATGGVTAAQLNVVVSGDTGDAESKLGGIGSMVNGVSGFFQTALGSALGFLGASGVLDAVSGAVSGLVGALGDMITQGEQAENAMKQTETVLRSTHDASGQTASGIEDLATHWMLLTGIQDDVEQSMMNVLLTFTNISGKTFPQAVGAINDVSAAMHEDLQSAAIQVGKALNDPVKGMTALQRIGVTFTDAQKKAVKQMEATGNMAGAQAIILAELSREFGGSAKAAGSTFAGQLGILQARFDNLKQTIGQAILPILGALLGAFMPIGELLMGKVSDGVTTAAKNLQTALKPVMADVAAIVKNDLMPAITNAANWLQNNLAPAMRTVANSPLANEVKRTVGVYKAEWLPVLQKVWQGIQQNLIPALKQAAPSVRDIGAAIQTGAATYEHLYGDIAKIAGIIAAGLVPILNKLEPVVVKVSARVGEFYSKVLQRAAPVIQRAADAVTKFAGELATRLGPAFENIMKILKPGLDWVEARWTQMWPYLSIVFNTVWGIIQGIIQVAWNFISGIILVGLDLIGGNWKQAGEDWKASVHGIWDGIKQIFKSAIGGVIGIVAQLISDVKAKFTAWVNSMPGIGKAIVQGLINGIKGMIGNAVGALGDLGNQMLQHFKSIFGIHSPSTVTAQLGAYLSQGLIQGVQSVNVAGPVGSHFASALSGISAGALSGSAGGAFGATGASGAGNAVNLVLDGRTLARAILPYIAGEIRLATGARQ